MKREREGFERMTYFVELVVGLFLAVSGGCGVG